MILKHKTILIVIVVLTAFLAGFFLHKIAPHTQDKSKPTVHPTISDDQIDFWTCSMHPQIQQPGPGQCPICGMDLIPVKKSDSEQDGQIPQLHLSPAAVKISEIETVEVQRRHVTIETRLVGKVDFDETRLAYISAYVDGRIDRLYVDYTGTPINKGEHLVYLYSPDLIVAQQELLEAHRSFKEIQNSTLEEVKKSALLTVKAAREKLRLLGLTEEQIATIEQIGKPEEHLTIYSPISGIVIHKNAVEGMYVSTGTKIYTIADLSKVWVRLQAYESDLQWIRYGQDIEFTAEAYPGENFKGQITFIDPVLDEKTRTVNVRVNVPNPDGKLKPGLFVRGIVYSQVTDAGTVLNPELAGKWICSMHPEIIKDKPGTCDICAMPLVTTESLGYAQKYTTPQELPLVIPATAPLITGKRAVVYVQVPDSQTTYEGKEVVLGPRASDYYIVISGLVEGERVVVKGNFKIDSALQIKAKPSMMSPESDGGARIHQHGISEPRPELPRQYSDKPVSIGSDFRNQLESLFMHYFKIQVSLSKDDFKSAITASHNLTEALEKINMTNLSGTDHEYWMSTYTSIKSLTMQMTQSENIENLREKFTLLSDTLHHVLKQFGPLPQQSIVVFYCSMAFNNRGALWLQENDDLKNPYFGSSMLTCGEQREVIKSTKDINIENESSHSH